MTAFAAVLLFPVLSGFAQDPSKRMEMGQYAKAKSAYLEKYNKKQTSDPNLFFNLGNLYLKTNQNDSAAFFFKQGILLAKSNPLNYVGLANYYYQTGDTVQAKSNLKYSASLARNNPDYYLALAEMYMQPNPGNTALAEKNLDKALELKPGYAKAHILKGDFWLTQNKAGEAANSYKQAIYYDKNNPLTHYKAGQIYARGRIYQDAINEMKKAIAIDSNYVPAYRDMGEIYLLYDQYPFARKSYDSYISKIDPEPNDLIRYASILVLDKDYAKASEILAQLKAKNVEDKNILRLQAYTDYETGKYQTGLASIQSFFQNPQNVNPIASDYEYYGNLLRKNNMDSLAIPQFLKVIELDSTKFSLNDEIGKIYEKAKYFPEAAHYYEIMLTKKQPTQVDYFKIGRLYYLAATNKIFTDSVQKLADSLVRPERVKKASENFAKVSELSPNNHLGWLFQARTQTLLDPETELGLAKPYYEKALVIMNANPEKFKKEITEALKYIGFYYYVKFDNATKEAKKADIPLYRDSSLVYWNNILTMDPADKQAADAINALKQKPEKIK
jgi:predicted Zn-dependent protease